MERAWKQQSIFFNSETETLNKALFSDISVLLLEKVKIIKLISKIIKRNVIRNSGAGVTTSGLFRR